MRTLKFNVDDLIITADEACDFTNLVPGSAGYLKAVFSFSPLWDDCVKVASFWSVMGEEFPAQVLDENNSCVIPAEALKNRVFKVQVLGKGNKIRLKTNKVSVEQIERKVDL